MYICKCEYWCVNIDTYIHIYIYTPIYIYLFQFHWIYIISLVHCLYRISIIIWFKGAKMFIRWYKQLFISCSSNNLMKCPNTIIRQFQKGIGRMLLTSIKTYPAPAQDGILADMQRFVVQQMSVGIFIKTWWPLSWKPPMNILYTICGAVCFQFTHFSCDDWENIYTLSYYHNQIGSMSYHPSFRVSSWNNGVRCMSFYILMNVSSYICHLLDCMFIFYIPYTVQLFVVYLTIGCLLRIRPCAHTITIMGRDWNRGWNLKLSRRTDGIV